LNNGRREASRYFRRKKKRDYLKVKINELAANNKNKISDLHKGINEWLKT
jgi:hypothetical protein